MSYPTILTFLTDGAEALTPAMTLATRLDAHIDVISMGIDRTQNGYNYGDINALMLQNGHEAALKTATDVRDKAKHSLQGRTLRYGLSRVVCAAQDVSRMAARHARFADLVVLPQPYAPDAEPEAATLIEACLFNADAPTVICPPDCGDLGLPKRVIVAWNESSEAMAAVRASLPLLKQADTVFVTVIDPPDHGPDRSDPGGMISQMLARHGVRCEVDVLTKTTPRISDVLLKHVMDRDADMVVMGAYGHSRFREAIFGGATRHMLETATVPVLMAR